MKKIVKLLLIGMGALTLTLGLTACDFGWGNKNPDLPAHSHKWSTTYIEDGDRHYQTCNGCEEKKYSDHDFTNGDCVCGKEKPAETHTHEWSKLFVEDGDKHYQTCNGCDEKKYSDHDFTNGYCVCGKEKPVEVHTHDWSKLFVEDGDRHYQTCNGCDEKKYSDHDFTNGDCVCGKKKPPEEHVHSMTYNFGMPNGCDFAGTLPHYHCSGCNKNFADEAGTKEMTSIVDPATGHDWDNGTLTQQPTCTQSGIKVYTCANYSHCQRTEEIPPMGHLMVKHEEVPATCLQDGTVAHYSCSRCVGIFADEEGMQIIEKSVIPATGHDLIKHEGIEPTCTEEGVITYYSCGACNKNYSDENGQQEVENLIAPAKGHTWNDNVCEVCHYDAGGSKGLKWGIGHNSCSVRGIGTCTDCEVVIPKVYNGRPVVVIESEAFYNCDFITHIEIPDSVTDFRRQAFRGCNSLERIFIPKSVTNIEMGVFGGCSSIAGIEVHEENPVYHSSGNCLIETQNKKLIKGCKNSTIPEDGSVTCLGISAFASCVSLETIIIPNTIVSIESSAFNSCYALKDITIPDSVNNFGEGVFKWCESLENISLPNMENTFTASYLEITSIKNVIIRGGKSLIDNAFLGCKNLINISLPESMTHIGNYAFIYSGLVNIEIPKNVISIGDCAFSGCVELLSVTMGEQVRKIGERAFQQCYKLERVNIPNNVTEIGKMAFSFCHELKEIEIPQSVEYIGEGAFAQCMSLVRFTVDENNTSYVGKDGILYDKATSDIICIPFAITGDVVISNGVTSINEDAFKNHLGLTSIRIPESVAHIGKNAFPETYLTIYCEAVEKPIGWDSAWNTFNPVIWDCKNNDKDKEGYAYKTIGGVRYRIKNGVASVTGQSAVLSGNIEILESIEYCDESYSVTSIESYAFWDCDELTGVKIPDSITSIGNNAFESCGNLKILSLSKNLISIPKVAFAGCSSLTSVVIPDSVTSIGSSAFYKCGSLTDITYQGTKAEWEAIKKASDWDTNTGNYTVHCADGDIVKE